MPATRKNISDTVRVATRKALESGKLDRGAVRKVTRQVRRSLKDVERLLVKDLRLSMNATLLSGAMAARIASGMLAGIADSLAQKTPRRPR
jgi:hypothetical protein